MLGCRRLLCFSKRPFSLYTDDTLPWRRFSLQAGSHKEWSQRRDSSVRVRPHKNFVTCKLVIGDVIWAPRPAGPPIYQRVPSRTPANDRLGSRWEITNCGWGGSHPQLSYADKKARIALLWWIQVFVITTPVAIGILWTMICICLSHWHK